MLPAVILLLVAVGIGMYFLGHRSQPKVANGTQTAAGAPIAPAVTGRHFAPHDTFYLLDYVSAKTGTGVIGFEPGRKVRLVEARPATQTLVVADDEAQVEVGPEKLTNDLDIAALARQKDQANQAKIAAYLQQEKVAYDQSQREAAKRFEKAVDKMNQDHEKSVQTAAAATPNPTNAPVGSRTKLDEPPVTVGGSSGYGYAGSSYYGSPYSYFNGSVGGTTTSVPAAASGMGIAPNAASVGAGRR